MKEQKIKINGMVCEGCENRVKKALERLEGVTEVQADHESGMVTIKTEEELNSTLLKETLDKIGFEVVEDEK